MKKLVGGIVLVLFVIYTIFAYAGDGIDGYGRGISKTNVVEFGADIVNENYTGDVLDDASYHGYKREGDKLSVFVSVAPPAQSAKYTPVFNDEIKLPEWYKEELKNLAKEPATYYELALKVKFFIMKNFFVMNGTSNLMEILKQNVIRNDEPMSEVDPAVQDEIVERILEDKKVPSDWSFSPLHAILYARSLEYLGFKTIYVDGIQTFPTNGTLWISWQDYWKYFEKHPFQEVKIPMVYVEYYDPASGWVMISPDWNVIETGIPAMFIPVDSGKTPYVATSEKSDWTLAGSTTFWPVRKGLTNVYYKKVGNKIMVISTHCGIVVGNSKEIHYVPANTVAIIPADWDFSFKNNVKEGPFPIKYKIENGKIVFKKNVTVVDYSN